MGGLIDERLIASRLEGLPGVDEADDRAGVGAALNVEVTASNQPPRPGRDTLKGPVLRFRGSSHPITVEVLEVQRRLQRVVHVRQAVPHPIRLVDHHVVHLHREPDVGGRVPDRVVHVRANRERLRLLLAVLDVVQPGAIDRAEVAVTYLYLR